MIIFFLVNTINKNTEVLFVAGKRVRVEPDTEVPRYMVMSRHQTAGQNYNIKVTRDVFENATRIKYSVTSQNYI